MNLQDNKRLMKLRGMKNRNSVLPNLKAKIEGGMVIDELLGIKAIGCPKIEASDRDSAERDTRRKTETSPADPGFVSNPEHQQSIQTQDHLEPLTTQKREPVRL